MCVVLHQYRTLRALEDAASAKMNECMRHKQETGRQNLPMEMEYLEAFSRYANYQKLLERARTLDEEIDG